MFKIEELFDLSETIASSLFRQILYPWDVLDEIPTYILQIGELLPEDDFFHPKTDIWIAKDAMIQESAYIDGPCIIDHGAQIRHCALIRNGAIIGQNTVVGNSTEVKNAILFNNVETPHYNYIGDSILGFHAHMGAGSVTSNIKSDRSAVTIHDENGMEIYTNRIKIGAMLGDFTEIGCNSVLNPGTVIGRYTSVYPTSNVRGVLPANSIYKDREHVIARWESK